VSAENASGIGCGYGRSVMESTLYATETAETLSMVVGNTNAQNPVPFATEVIFALRSAAGTTEPMQRTRALQTRVRVVATSTNLPTATETTNPTTPVEGESVYAILYQTKAYP
jgi:hypothetical protein